MKMKKTVFTTIITLIIGICVCNVHLFAEGGSLELMLVSLQGKYEIAYNKTIGRRIELNLAGYLANEDYERSSKRYDISHKGFDIGYRYYFLREPGILEGFYIGNSIGIQISDAQDQSDSSINSSALKATITILSFGYKWVHDSGIMFRPHVALGYGYEFSSIDKSIIQDYDDANTDFYVSDFGITFGYSW